MRQGQPSAHAETVTRPQIQPGSFEGHGHASAITREPGRPGREEKLGVVPPDGWGAEHTPFKDNTGNPHKMRKIMRPGRREASQGMEPPQDQDIGPHTDNQRISAQEIPHISLEDL